VLEINFSGPHFPAPLESPDDLSKLLPIEEAFHALTYVYEAITLTRKLLEGRVPLIGNTYHPILFIIFKE